MDNTTPAQPGEDYENTVLYEIVEPHIARITLNRPERRNAIVSPEMNIVMHRHLVKAQDDDEVKVIILAGEGRRYQ